MRLFFASILSLCAAAAFASPRAMLKEQAEIQGERIRLGDVAILTGFNAARAAELEALDLGAAPRAGQAERVSARRIVAFVLRHAPDAKDFEWGGARQVLIRREAKLVEAEEIQAAIAFSIDGVSIRAVELNGERHAFEIPNTSYELVVNRIDLSPDCSGGRALVSAVGSESTLATVPVRFKLALEGTGCPSRIAVEQSYAPAATRHDPITVEVEESGLMLKTTAIALQDARVGETLNVRNPVSAETYRVRIVAPGRATLAMD